MFASMDLSNGYLITSRVDLIGLSDEDLARVLEPPFVTAIEIANANHFRDAMLAAATALLNAPCGGLKC